MSHHLRRPLDTPVGRALYRAVLTTLWLANVWVSYQAVQFHAQNGGAAWGTVVLCCWGVFELGLVALAVVLQVSTYRGRHRPAPLVEPDPEMTDWFERWS